MIRLWPTLLLVLPVCGCVHMPPPAGVPGEAVVLYDPGREMTCVTDRNDCITSASSTLAFHDEIDLRVESSRLLTRYILHWGAEAAPSSASFPILGGGPVHALVLNLPTALPATPESTVPGTKWTANSILASLLDPGDSATPQADLERQNNEPEVRSSELRSEIDSFNELYNKVVSNAGARPATEQAASDPGSGPGMIPDCDPLRHSGFNLALCLSSASNNLPDPQAVDTSQLLTLDRAWRQRFKDVQSFAREFNDNRIGERATGLESAILFDWRQTEVFHANLQACEDAYSLGEDIVRSGPSATAALAARLQIRARLTAAAGASDSMPSSLLERERLTGAEVDALRAPTSLLRMHLNNLHKFCQDHQFNPNSFGADLADLRSKLHYLPLLVKSINDIQSQTIVVLNSIYENATIGPIVTLYNTGLGPKEESVSYSIGVIHQFTPYTLVASQPAEGDSIAVTQEVIVANGAFTIPGPKHRSHLLTGLLAHLF